MIDPKIKQAWLALRSLGDRITGAGAIIADAYIDAEAGRRMAEHYAIPHTVAASYICEQCRLTIDDWKAEVIAEISA